MSVTVEIDVEEDEIWMDFNDEYKLSFSLEHLKYHLFGKDETQTTDILCDILDVKPHEIIECLDERCMKE